MLAVLLLLVLPVSGFALPQNGTIAGGHATITTQQARVDIRQHSNRAVIDWRGFDVSAHEVVQFHQPDSSSLVVNRVNSSSGSYIDGQVSANGRLVILNQNGVMFGPNARVDASAVVASTARISTHDAMHSGRYMPGSNPNAKVVNQGRITARDAGLVGLVAPQVENHGVIEARLGKVQLISGDRFTLDMAGDGLLNVSLESNAASQLVKNQGAIMADGGRIQLSAAQARHQVDQLILNQGVVQANRVSMKGGVIVLSATSDQGRVVQAGHLKAQGGMAEDTGGTIRLLARDIELASTSMIVADGPRGGGVVHVGGGKAGKGEPINAHKLVVSQGAVTSASATDKGHGGEVVFWSDGVTSYQGHSVARGGDNGGDGGFIEVSGKDYLDFRGTADTSAPQGKVGELLLDPGDIVVCQYGASSDASCNPSGAPDLVAAAGVYNSGANAISYVNIGNAMTAGTLLNLLATTNVTIQTNASGAGNGDITVADAIAWTANTRLTLDAHRDIVVNAPISGRLQTYTVGRDLDLNAVISDAGATSTLIIQPKNTTGIMSVGSNSASFNIDATDRSNIAAGWDTVQLGSTAFLGTINVDGWNYAGALNLYTGNGTININGAVSTGAGNFTINTRNLNVGAALTGTGTLTLQPDATAVTIGLGNGAAGTFNLNETEVGFLTDGWAAIVAGRTNGTGAIDVRALTWRDPTTIRTGNAAINVNGAQIMTATNALTLSSRVINISAALSGAGALTIQPDTNTSVGIGNGSAGVHQLNTAELGFITNGWSSIVLGGAGNTGAMDIQAATWNDPVTFRNGTGAMNLNGVQNFQGNNATFLGRNMVFNQNLVGTGVLTIAPDNNVTMGIGDGQPGVLSLTNAKLNRIMPGWTNVIFGSNSTLDSVMTIGAYAWGYNVDFRVDDNHIIVAGAQNGGAFDMVFRSDRDIIFNAPVSGTGSLTLASATTNGAYVIGAAGAATEIPLATISQIQPGFANVYIGTTADTGTKTFQAVNWHIPVTLRSNTGVMTFSGAQNMGTNNLTIQANSNPAINAALTGGGTLWFRPLNTNTTLGIAGGAGTFNLTAAELNQISDGWGEILFGRNDLTVATTINAYANWRDHVRFLSNTGVITVAGNQNFGSANATFETNANPAINFALAGTGTLTFRQASNTVTMGLAGAGGTVALSTAELDQITNGWTQLVFGNENSTALTSINAYANWQDNVLFRSNTGGITIAGNQNFNSNQAVFETNANLNINANVSGTGNLIIRPGASGVSIGLAGAGGALNVDAAELARIQAGWAQVTFGRADNSAALTVAGFSGWNNPISFVSGSGGIHVTGAQDFHAYDVTFQTTGDVGIGANMSGSGILTFYPGLAATSVGVAGGGGTLNLSAAELDYLQDGWSQIVIGRSDATAAIHVGAYNNWRDPVRLMRSLGDASNSIVLSGNQAAVAATNASLRYSGPLLLAADVAITTAGGDIRFDGTLDGAHQLTLNAGVGDVRFDDAVGSNAALDSLSVTSDSLTIASTVEASGDIDLQPYTAGRTIGLEGGAGSWQLGTGVLSGITASARLKIGTLTSGNVTTGGAINVPSRLLMLSGGTVQLNGSVTTSGNGNSLVIVANIFDNQAGAGSLNPGSGRYLIYSTNPANDTRGETSGFTKRYNKTYVGYGPSSVTETGNLFLYSYMPTLTVSGQNTSRVYGDANPVFTAVYSGLIDGDLIGDVISGMPVFSSSATVSTGVGVTAIQASLGALFSEIGYDLVADNTGVLTITPAVLTVTVQHKTRVYGDVNPLLTLGFSGFKGSDDDALFTGYSLSTSANAATGVGTAAINLSGGNAGANYTIVRNDGVLTITPATLTVRANNATRSYGDANPGFTYSVNGLRNGDSSMLVSGVNMFTSATASSPVGSYDILASSGTIASANYTLAYANGTLTVLPAVNAGPAPLPESLAASFDKVITEPMMQSFGYMSGEERWWTRRTGVVKRPAMLDAVRPQKGPGYLLDGLLFVTTPVRNYFTLDNDARYLSKARAV
jgi:filamentous hemagglutinin family protein